MPTGFRWNEWNLDHATKHGCTIEEIESVVRSVGHRRARREGEAKWGVEGRGTGGRMIRVLYILDDKPAETIYVIHAMPLTTRRRRGARR